MSGEIENMPTSQLQFQRPLFFRNLKVSRDKRKSEDKMENEKHWLLPIKAKEELFKAKIHG